MRRARAASSRGRPGCGASSAAPHRRRQGRRRSARRARSPPVRCASRGGGARRRRRRPRAAPPWPPGRTARSAMRCRRSHRRHRRRSPRGRTPRGGPRDAAGSRRPATSTIATSLLPAEARGSGTCRRVVRVTASGLRDVPVARQEDVHRRGDVGWDPTEGSRQRVDDIGQTAGLRPRFAFGGQHRDADGRHGGHRSRSAAAVRSRRRARDGELNRFTWLHRPAIIAGDGPSSRPFGRGRHLPAATPTRRTAPHGLQPALGLAPPDPWPVEPRSTGMRGTGIATPCRSSAARPSGRASSTMPRS